MVNAFQIDYCVTGDFNVTIRSRDNAAFVVVSVCLCVYSSIFCRLMFCDIVGAIKSISYKQLIKHDYKHKPITHCSSPIMCGVD